MTDLGSRRGWLPAFILLGAVLPLIAGGCDTRSRRGPGDPNVDRRDGGRMDGGRADVPPIEGTPDMAPACQPDDAPKKLPGQDCVCDGDCSTNTCTAGVCCSGAACGGKRPPGTSCTSADQCDSGFCADGVCCNVACTGSCVSCSQPDRMGECAPVPAGADDPHDVCRQDSPDTCGQSGACNGQGGCAKYPQGTICKLGSCEGKERYVPPSSCDGEGVCVVSKPISCYPSTCEDGACSTSCTNDSQCMTPAVCRDNTCGKRGPGQDCTSADQCGSGFCVDGVCCDSTCAGSCYSCSLPTSRGTCTAVPANAADPKMICKDGGRAACGTDGKCDGQGGCQKYKDGTPCSDPRCDANANAETPAGTCRAGSCEVPAARTCAPHKGCTGGRCLTACGSDGQCTSGNFCVMGTCGKRPDGALCSGDAQCVSGTCAQGRCCATGCTGSCKSCAVPGKEGVCSNVPTGGSDPAGVCRDDACSNGCNGSGGCRREPAGTTCGSATCTANTRNTRVCNASGGCETRSEVCGGATPECMGGSCVPPAKTPNGGTCLNGAECQSGQCVANRCCANACSGECRECLAPNWTCSNRAGMCSGGVCSAGICCAAGQTACGGACRNLQTDPNHCGMCGKKCAAATPSCVAGVCQLVCQPGQTNCSNRCVDLGSDVNHCGMCGKKCGAGAWTCTGMPPTCKCANTVCGTTCCAAGKVCGGAGGNSCVDPPTCNPMTCAAMGPCRECKLDGTCGFKAAMTACNDGNPCTLGETCTAMGACQGGAPKTCTTPGACERGPGTCNPTTGNCSYPPVVCDKPGVCERAQGATCDPGTGMCNYPATPGAFCNDQNPCTTGDRCSGKTCSGMPKACTTPGACEKADGATCNPMTGACQYPANTGATCDDSNMCTSGTTCKSDKTCGNGTVTTCTSPGTCERSPGTCNPMTGACSYSPADTTTDCDDGNLCTTSDHCDGARHCVGTAKVCNMPPGKCDALMGTCSPGTGQCEYGPGVGRPCDDGLMCTNMDACNEMRNCEGKPIDGCMEP